MNTFQFVMEWLRCVIQQRNSILSPTSIGHTCFINVRSRRTVINDISKYISPVLYSFQPHGINWLPDNKLVQVYCRDFCQALFSLLTHPQLVHKDNFSFPLPDTPFLPDGFKIDTNTPLTELHHGRWWTDSWKSLCKNPDEILVPIILYMDGILLDPNSYLNLTPLNMTLGIFKTDVQKQACAWETLYFHPDKIISNKKSSGLDTVTNLHSDLRLALKSF